MTFSTLKMLLVFGLAAAGLGVMGAIGGFGLAALLILCIASAAAPRVSCAGPVRIAQLFSFQLYISMFTVISNLCLKTDLFLLKRLSPAAESDLLAAYYASAQALAFIPYQAIISVTFVIFPLVSRLTYIQDTAQVREYIREALRYSLLLTLLIAVLFSSNAQGTVRLLFPRGYENAGQALSILVFGIVFFSLFLVGATIISGSGRVAHSVLIGVGTLLLDVFLNSRLIPAHGLRGAAAATTAAMFAGLAATWVYLPMRFGRCLPAGAVIRGCAAAGAVYAVSVLTPGHGILLIGKFAILALLYLAILMALGEIGSADLARARRIAKTF